AYRTLFQWFGNSEKGKLPNPLSGEALNVTVRSYLKLLNMKANHRKTLVTENHGMILSSNPHDPSGYHHNVGVRVSGPLQKSIIIVGKIMHVILYNWLQKVKLKKRSLVTLRKCNPKTVFQ